MFFLVVSNISAVSAETGDVSKHLINEVSAMSDDDISDRLTEIDNTYDINVPFSTDDANFVIALSELEKQKTTPYGGNSIITTDFKINNVTGALKENWFSYADTPFTKYYLGSFDLNLYTNRNLAKSATLSINHNIYGLVGGKVGIIKNYSDSERFTVSPNIMTYNTTFGTPGGVALYSNTSVNIKIESGGSIKSQSFSIKAK